MVKLTAAQLVDKLLEYAGATPPPAGSADDPWRQGGFKKFKFTAKDVLRGNRPTPIKIKVPPKSGTPPFKHDLPTRFKWKPEANGE